mmetsp:Transcript_11137/g.16421  ORF Transcript_11137/g.16421 Transcript_11137/m.16421 type:complete len:1104 (-) Transcript_11137:766-4077(-)
MKNDTLNIEGITEENAEDVEASVINKMERSITEAEEGRLKDVREEFKRVSETINLTEVFLKENRHNRSLAMAPQLSAAKNRLQRLKKKKVTLVKQLNRTKMKMANNLSLVSDSRNEVDRLVREGIITPIEANLMRQTKSNKFQKKIEMLHSAPAKKRKQLEREVMEKDYARNERIAGKKLNELKKMVSNKRLETLMAARERKSRVRKRSMIALDNERDIEVIDDGCPNAFQKRKIRYSETVHNQLGDDFIPPPKTKKEAGIEVKDEFFDDEESNMDVEDEITDEQVRFLVSQLPHVRIEGKLKSVENTWDSLFDYQQTGVKWLWELHQQRVGGIIGDEMGLGKTIQISAFFSALYCSNLFKTSLVLCPATVMNQWVRELHIWAPMLRSCIFHSRGSCEYKDQLDMMDTLIENGAGVVVTTYESFRRNHDAFLSRKWQYVVLDEGHKLKNPNADITYYCKQIKTEHRIILSGTPIQNTLVELWSLFDFVYPGKLGTLPMFKSHFAIPISTGGFSNADNQQVNSAHACAVTLRDLIQPYMLRRMKKDVKHELPKKTERVLFCQLLPQQVYLYRRYLRSHDITYTLRNAGSGMVLKCIQVLRQLCNHPDLLLKGSSRESQSAFGAVERSAKLKALDTILKLWKEEGHKVLLFSQSRMMLDVLEMYLCENDFNYLRMDGTTSVGARMALVDEFNHNPDKYVFLMTSRVGGLGLNLTSANRIILYDPDWNPSIDRQALARCWRHGQKREVVVYRLMTRGTIEEKMYHRQIHKLFLSNKILTDPRQKRFISSHQLKDLFTLGSEYDHVSINGKFRSTETGRLFGEMISNEWQSQMDDDDDNEKENSMQYQPSLHEKNSGESSKVVYKIEEFREKEKMKEGASTEQKLLKNLFDDNSVESVFDHGKLVGQTMEETNILRQRAFEVAKRSAQVLQRSSYKLKEKMREELSGNSSMVTPTMTRAPKRFGSSNTPRFGSVTKQRFGGITRTPKKTVNLSPQLGMTASPQLLHKQRIMGNQAPSLSSNEIKQSLKRFTTYSDDKDEQTANNFALQLIQRFRQAPQFEMSTKKLSYAFASIAGESNLAIFESTLVQIARFNKKTRLWRLKTDFYP